MQCDAVCCSVLQCVAVCCSVLQCVAACLTVLQYHSAQQLCWFCHTQKFTHTHNPVRVYINTGLTLFHSLGKILHNKRLPRPLPTFPHSIHHDDVQKGGGGGGGGGRYVGEPGRGDRRGRLGFVPEHVVGADGKRL